MVCELVMDVLSLRAKIKESRKVEIVIPDTNIVFYATRMTGEEFRSIVADNVSDAEISRRFVIGWKGVTEADLIEGGSAKDEIPFDKDLFNDIIGDHDDWFLYIASNVGRAALDRVSAQASNAKK